MLSFRGFILKPTEKANVKTNGMRSGKWTFNKEWSFAE